MIADLKQDQLDYVDQVPFNAINVLKEDSNISVNTYPGFETTNITWNSNPKKPKNRELLDPQVKKALSMCVDREKIIDVVFAGYADTVESIVGHIAPLENPDLGPLEHDCAAGNQTLDQLGYTKGANGIRIAPATTGANAQPAHPMQYNIMTPTSTDFNINRAFDIVQEGFKEAGVEVTQQVGGDSTAAYAIETGDNCDADKLTGYDKFDIAMWDWVGYIDPDFMLSVVTRGQWCSWSDTGWVNDEYDKLYDLQGQTVDPGQAEGDRLRDAEDGVRQLPLHPAHQRTGDRREQQEVGRLLRAAGRLLKGVLHRAASGRLVRLAKQRGGAGSGPPPSPP